MSFNPTYSLYTVSEDISYSTVGFPFRSTHLIVFDDVGSYMGIQESEKLGFMSFNPTYSLYAVSEDFSHSLIKVQRPDNNVYPVRYNKLFL